MPTSYRYTRRQFLAAATAAAGAAEAQPLSDNPQFLSPANRPLQTAYDAALAGLHSNVQPLYRFPRPLLIEGATYIGAWLECAPLEGLAYGPISLDTAFDNHTAFFDLQREEDGYIPCNIKKDRLGTGQIQMVVPIAATAWDLYRDHRKDSAFLEKAYRACARWDQWLTRFRNNPQYRAL